MTWSFSLTSIVLALASAIAVPATINQWRSRHKRPGSGLTALTLVCGIIILAGNSLEIIGSDLSWKIFWTKFQIVGFAVVPTLWLLYALEFSGFEEWRYSPFLISISVVPIAFLLMTYSNPFHHLIVSEWKLDESNGNPTLLRENGLLLWAYGVYAVLLSLIATYRASIPFFRSDRLYRWQVGIVIAGAVLTTGAAVLDLFALKSLAAIKLYPLMLAAAVPLISLSLFRLQLADFLPLARVEIAETMTDPVIVLSAEDIVLEMNSAALKLVVQERSEVVGRELAQVWPKLAYWFIRHHDTLTQSGEVTLTHKPGRHVFDLSVSTRKDWRGHVAYHVLALRDITRLKQMEVELSEREALYRSLVETSPDAIALTDLAGSLLTVNHQTAQLLGFETVEALLASEKNAFDMIAPEDQARALADLQQNFADGPVRNLEYRIIRQDGSLVPIEVSASVVTDSMDEPIALLSVIRDTTDRKQADEKLRRSEERYRLIAENSRDVIWTTDMNMRATYISPSVEWARGYTVEEAMNQSIDEIFTPESKAIALQTFAKALSQAHERSDVPIPTIELDYKCKDGSTFCSELKWGFLRNPDGELTGILGVGRDISARKQMEQRLRDSLHEKEVLLREIHHRVKNNMQVISSLLRLQAGSITDQHIDNMFKDSQNRIRAMGLVHEQLYQSQNLANINLADYIRNLTDSLSTSHSATRAGIGLRVEAEDIYVDIDTGMPCGLIINELVTNSLKHAFGEGQPGTIWVRLLTGGEGQPVIEVQDTGKGFPESFDINNVETLGWQLINSLTQQLNGTITFSHVDGALVRVGFRGNRFDEV